MDFIHRSKSEILKAFNIKITTFRKLALQNQLPNYSALYLLLNNAVYFMAYGINVRNKEEGAA
jgi:hypothetical protein